MHGTQVSAAILAAVRAPLCGAAAARPPVGDTLHCASIFIISAPLRFSTCCLYSSFLTTPLRCSHLV
ncbi:hypothetical protein EON67_10505 [archaeon]|nr:MAG: hypothetical protein EON67_10505 [archaeon]